MIAAVLQPNYIPWKGYFDIIHDVDIFVFYSDVQYTTSDWRNRNKIKTEQGLKWLSVPVGQRHMDRLICEVAVKDSSWQSKHYNILKDSYKTAPYFKLYNDFLEDVYLGRKWESLYELDRYMIEHIAKNFLGITTKFADSREFPSHGAKNEKLLSLLSAILRTGGGVITLTYPVLLQKIISSLRCILSKISKLSGKVTKVTLNTRSCMASLLITFQSWICYLTSAMMLRIIFGAGGKRPERLRGLRNNFVAGAGLCRS